MYGYKHRVDKVEFCAQEAQCGRFISYYYYNNMHNARGVVVVLNTLIFDDFDTNYTFTTF